MCHTQQRPRNPKHTLLIPINSPALSLSKPRKKKTHKTAPEEKKKRLIRDYWLAKKKTETESKK